MGMVVTAVVSCRLALFLVELAAGVSQVMLICWERISTAG
jgi:uncharacterized membrane protein